MSNIYSSWASVIKSRDTENKIFEDDFHGDMYITEDGDAKFSDIIVNNITATGTITGTVSGTIEQTNVSAEDVTITGVEVGTTNGVIFKKSDGKLYNDAGLTYVNSQAILTATNIEAQTLKINTNANIAGDLSRGSLYATGQSTYRAISQTTSTGNTTVDSNGVTSLLSQSSNGVYVNLDANTNSYQNDTHKFTNILGETQMNLLSNGNVGLGTETPNARFHLASSGPCALRIDSTTTVDQSRIDFAQNNAAKVLLGTQPSGNFFIMDANNGNLFTHDIATNKTVISDVININGANDTVGIGTTTPNAKLDVLANTTTPAVKITQTGTGDAFQVYDEANDTTPFIIKNNGNVGIGLSDPLFKLDITGETDVNMILNNSAGIEATGIYFRQQGGNKNYIYSTTQGDLFVGNQTNGNILVHDTIGNKTVINDAIYIDGANDYVGVGTASPGAKLDVSANSTNPAVKITQTGTGDALQIHDVANDSTRFAVDAEGDVSIKRASKLGTSCLTMVGIENLSGVNAITFDTLGGVGGFDFWSKSMIMGGYVDRTTGTITFSNSNGEAPGAIFGSYFICDGGDTHIGSCNIARTGALVDTLTNIAPDYTRIFINGLNGNVGMGTTAPSCRLDVTSPTGTQVHIDSTTASQTSLKFRHNNQDVAYMGIQSTGDFFIYDVEKTTNILTFAKGTKRTTLNGDLIEMGATVIPSITATYDLGNDSTRKWNDIYSVNSPTHSSDRNLKQNIVSLDTQKSLDFVNDINPVSYQLKQNESGRYHHGVIAQELETVINTHYESTANHASLVKSVYTDEETGEEKTNYGVRYTELIADLIGAVKELKTRNEALEAKNEALEARVLALEGQ